jgi:hypothetical protein
MLRTNKPAENGCHSPPDVRPTMMTLLRIRLAALATAFGLFGLINPGSAAPDETRTDTVRKIAPAVKLDPKTVKPLPEIQVLPKVDLKPVPESKGKPDVKLPPAVLVPKPPVRVPDLKPNVVPKPDATPIVRSPLKPIDRPVLIHTPGKLADSQVKLPAGPGLKLKPDFKFDAAELAKVKPPVDLSKTKPQEVLGAKPPIDFKMKPIALEKIHIPNDAVKITKLNVLALNSSHKFAVNPTPYALGNYHTKFGTKCAWGFCYPGRHHCHWHHSFYDPCFGCHYFYCGSSTTYYYWCEADLCYYPCWWFVDHGGCYYPWWTCGGFAGYGYHSNPCVTIIINW